jgi:hypothetical protein
VGFVHAADCPVFHGGLTPECPPSLRRLIDDEPAADPVSPVRAAIPDDDAGFLGALKTLLRAVQIEKLWRELAVAARELARKALAGGDWLPIGDQAAPAHFCRECQMVEHLGKLTHAESCHVGRVLDILDRLAVLQQEDDSARPAMTTDPSTKDVPGDGTNQAEDGTRPRGLNQRLCLKCGRRDGAWTTQELSAAEISLEFLGLNQCLNIKPQGNGGTLHTHECGARNAQPVSPYDLASLRCGAPKGGAR